MNCNLMNLKNNVYSRLCQILNVKQLLSRCLFCPGNRLIPYAIGQGQDGKCTSVHLWPVTRHI